MTEGKTRVVKMVGGAMVEKPSTILWGWTMETEPKAVKPWAQMASRWNRATLLVLEAVTEP